MHNTDRKLPIIGKDHQKRARAFHEKSARAFKQWQMDNGIVAQPVLKVIPNGIFPDIAFVEMPDDMKEALSKEQD